MRHPAKTQPQYHERIYGERISVESLFFMSFARRVCTVAARVELECCGGTPHCRAPLSPYKPAPTTIVSRDPTSKLAASL
jgi:hypothetical protein